MGRPGSEVKYRYAEYAALPEGAPYQLIGGELIKSPAPTRRHQEVSTRLLVALYNFVTPKSLGKVYGPPIDVILSDEDSPQPDIVYVSKARSGILVREGIRGGPDLCVEVLSKGTEKMDLGPKRVLYARHNVTEYWIVDPDGNTLDLYRLQEDAEEPRRKRVEADTLTTDLLPGFSLALKEVFAP